MWNKKFGEGLDKSVVKLTGETVADLKLLSQAHIVVTTPQKWDLLSRRWRVRKPVQAVSLYIVDELHLIGGEAGPTLEVSNNRIGTGCAVDCGWVFVYRGSNRTLGCICVQVVVSRTRYISSELADTHKIRIVGLSASVANAKDLGAWIGATGPKCLFHFHPQVRPVPLEIRIQGFDVAHLGARLLAMARPTYGALANLCSPGNPGVVFVPTRKQAQLTAIDIVSFAGADARPESFLHGGASSGEVNVLSMCCSGVVDGCVFLV